LGKRSYKELLKESIIKEFDTSKTADVKGPMLDAILSYTGDGELPTHQDAASILERYYYGEDEDKGINIMEAPQNEIPEVPEDNLNKAKDDIEDEVEPTKTVGDSSAVLIKSGPEDIEESEAIVEEDLENTVLERLISELDEQEELGDEPEEDTDEEEMEPKDVEKLDVDKELKEAEVSEVAGGGSLPGGKTSSGKKLGTSGSYSGDELEEAFQLFQEQIEDEDEEEEEEEEGKTKIPEEKVEKKEKKED